MERFNKIRNNSDCWEWKYLAWYNTNFEKICKTVPAGPKGDKWDTWPVWLQWPVWQKGYKWDSVTLNFSCPAWQFVVGFSNNSPICNTPSTSSTSWEWYTIYNNSNWTMWSISYSQDYDLLTAKYRMEYYNNRSAWEYKWANNPIVSYITKEWIKWNSWIINFTNCANIWMKVCLDSNNWPTRENRWYDKNAAYWWYSTISLSNYGSPSFYRVYLVELKWYK